MLKLIRKNIKGYFLLLVTIILLTAFLNYIRSLIPVLITEMLNIVEGKGNTNLPVYLRGVLHGNDLLLNVFFLLMAGFLFRESINIITDILATIVGEGIGIRVQRRFFSRIINLSYSDLSSIDTGDLIQRATNDVTKFKSFLTFTLYHFMNQLFLIVFFSIQVYFISPDIFYIVLAFMPVIFLSSIIYFFFIQRDFMKIEEIEGELTSITQENLTGIRVVKAFANEKYENDKFDKNMDNYYKVVKRINLKMSFFWSLSDLLIFIPLMIALWRTIDLALSPVAALSASSAVGIFMLIQNTLWPVRNLGRTISEIGRTSIACKRINEILNKKEEYDNDGTIEKNISGDIVFSNVSYKYENEYVLKNINLHIKPGEKIALIGRTGSGKSTLVHLINRMFDPSEGEILIDSVPTTSYKKHSLRRQIGVAMQEAFLFSRTIKDNIRISDLNISLDDVRRSAKIACIDDDIMGFAQGYDTLVGERGVTLSGGQKQRVAIARALVCAHPIIIFDDSLSALDTETDLKIQQALDKEQIRATTIIITHRIVTARKADRIIILEDGCISASGTHQELIKQDGLYQAIYNIQAAIQQSGDDKDA